MKRKTAQKKKFQMQLIMEYMFKTGEIAHVAFTSSTIAYATRFPNPSVRRTMQILVEKEYVTKTNDNATISQGVYLPPTTEQMASFIKWYKVRNLHVSNLEDES